MKRYNKKILVISPHPDDETLGAGGSLLKHKQKGDKIYWCIVTNMKEEYGFSKETVERRNEEIKNVCELFGFENFFNLELKPAGLTESDIPILIKNFNDIIEKIKPNILYIPFYGDAHSDHRIVFKSLYPFFKSFRYPYIKKVLMMEIISETDHQFNNIFQPNVYVNISEFLEKKLNIMQIYSTELGNHPFPRSLENIKSFAKYRGSQANCKYSEAFMLLKEVIE